MDLTKIDPAALEFTSEELDALAMILTKADQIQKDATLNRLVQKHMDKKITEFKNVDDLKKHHKNLTTEAVRKGKKKVETDVEKEQEEEPDE